MQNDTDVIVLRKNFRTTPRGSPLRHKTARQIRNIGDDEWKRIHNYGRRWIVEIYFSGLKRVIVGVGITFSFRAYSNIFVSDSFMNS